MRWSARSPRSGTLSGVWTSRSARSNASCACNCARMNAASGSRDTPHRADHGERVDDRAGRCAAIRFGAPVCRFGGPGATPAQHRRHTHAAGHQQAWRQEPQAAAGARRTSDHATNRSAHGSAGLLGARTIGPAPFEPNVVACALANKLARIAWAILAKGTSYRSEQAVSAT